MISVGNRIFMDFVRPDRELVEKFRGIPSSNINDEMNRLYCMHDYIRPMNHVPLLGCALTVKAPIGDNLFFHQALDMARAGDVIVVDGGSGCNRSLAGEIMFRFAEAKGLAGIVVDGCLRDSDSYESLKIPIYCKGITPQGPFKNGPGEINVPISCGGQVVFPGDILVGDADGIVVIRRQDAQAVAEAARAKFESETAIFERQRTDIESYAAKHKATTEKRMDGKNIVTLKSYHELYES